MTTRRKIILGAASSFVLPRSSSARGKMMKAQLHGTPIGQWLPVHIGGGGFMSGIDIVQSNNATCARCDIFGGFTLNRSTSIWTEILNSVSVPSALQSFGQGVNEMRIAPSNTNRIYLYWGSINVNNGTILRSDNGGSTWSQPDGGTFNFSMDPNRGADRLYGFYLAVDPNNADVAVVGTLSNGAYYTTNAGVNWTQIPSGAGLVGDGSVANIVAFDPTSSVVGGQTQTVFVFRNGTGLYRSTTGLTGTFTQFTGTNSPAGCVRLKINAANGDLFMCDGTNTLYYLQAPFTPTSAFTKRDPSGAGTGTLLSFSIDPTTSGGTTRIAATNQSGLTSVSNDNGATWGGYLQNSYAQNPGANPVPWLTNTVTSSNVNTSNVEYDSTGLLWLASGVGIWTTTPKTSGTNTYTEVTAGIENMRALKAVAPPGQNGAVFGVLDKRWSSKSKTDIKNGTYSTLQGFFPLNSTGIDDGSGLDYAKSSAATFFGFCANQNDATKFFFSTNNILSSSNWTQLSTTLVANNANVCASTPDHVTFIQMGTTGSLLYNSQNASSAPSDTWTNPVISGIATGAGDNGWGGGQFTNSSLRQTLCADTKNAGIQYAYNNGGNSTAGVYRSGDGGASWSRVFTGNLNGGHAGADGNGCFLINDPQVAGRLLFSPDNTGAHPALYECNSGDTANPQTWTQVLAANGYGFDVLPLYIAFGAPKPGNAKSSIFIVGNITGFNSGAFGVYRSDDDMQTWTFLGGTPANYIDNIQALAGDNDSYGVCYVGFSGSSWIWRTGP